jgi:NADPH-dependent curcumin reductase CurA
MSERVNHQWLLDARPVGRIKESDYRFVEEPLTELADGEVRVKVNYLSVDPANRGWVNEGGSYMAAIPLGAVMPAMGIGIVDESRDASFQKGDLVSGLLGWQEFGVSDGKGLQKLPQTGLEPTAFLGLLGHIGLTAYFGLLDIGQPKEGETLVVSAAAGAVGSLVGQIGKIKGCRVVGIAGTDEKCEWITKDLGFDEAINYKSGSILENLKKACPKGIDIYFENVGGEILEAVLALVNNHARIPLCGMISQYNSTQPVPGPKNFINLLVRRVHLQGFIVVDYLPRAMEGIADLIKWHTEGRLKYRVDIVEGLKEAPNAVNRLFDGVNQGKLILKVG